MTYAELLKWRSGRKKHHNLLRKERMIIARSKGSHIQSEWASLQEEFDYNCVGCGIGKLPLLKDHILPICLGGNDSIKNIQPLCVYCNSSKGTDSFNWVEFRRVNGFL